MLHEVVTEESACEHWTKALKERLVSTDGVTAFSPTDIVDATRGRLQAELKALQRLITLTYARVNSLSITARLPAEVLLRVFSMLSECDPPGSEPFSCIRSGEEQPLGWINATHVCRRWREVALSAPGLWTNVGAPQTVPWMEEMLVRSKQTPFTLSACLTLDARICRFIVKALDPAYICRMRGFHLSEQEVRSDRGNDLELRMAELRKHVFEHLDRPAPMLESLAFEDVTESYSQFPESLFANTLPRLRRFSDNKGPSKFWDAPYLRNLTGLDLNFGFQFSYGSLHALLRESPMLEDLRVTRGFSIEKCHYDGDVLALPALKTFYFDSKADVVCNGFLSSIAIPTSARQEYLLWGVFPEQQPLVLPASISAGDTKGVSTCTWPAIIRLNCNSKDARGIVGISLQAWTYDENENDDPPHFIMRCLITDSTPAARHVAGVQQLLGAFDITKLGYLSLFSERLDDDFCNVLGNAFSRMSFLGWLTLKGPGVGPLLSYLKKTQVVNVPSEPEDEEQDEEESQQSLFFPMLERFCVAYVPFDQALSDVLVEAIRKRNERKQRVPRLVLSGCEGSKPLVRRLSRLVGTMIHDGTE